MLCHVLKCKPRRRQSRLLHTALFHLNQFIFLIYFLSVSLWLLLLFVFTKLGFACFCLVSFFFFFCVFWHLRHRLQPDRIEKERDEDAGNSGCLCDGIFVIIGLELRTARLDWVLDTSGFCFCFRFWKSCLCLIWGNGLLFVFRFEGGGKAEYPETQRWSKASSSHGLF